MANIFSQGILNYHFYSYGFNIDLSLVQIPLQATYRYKSLLFGMALN